MTIKNSWLVSAGTSLGLPFEQLVNQSQRKALGNLLKDSPNGGLYSVVNADNQTLDIGIGIDGDPDVSADYATKYAQSATNTLVNTTIVDQFFGPGQRYITVVVTG